MKGLFLWESAAEYCGDVVDKKFKLGENFFVGFSSERIDPGVNENRISTIPKVISGYTNNCKIIISKLYEKVFSKLVKSRTIEIAEFSNFINSKFL